MILGITGLSGSGKHTAANFLAQGNKLILDTDTIAHRLYRPYTHVWKAITDRFGESILNQDDSINRQKLAGIVFDEKNSEASAEKLLELNKIIHPDVKRHLKNEIHRHFRRGSAIVIVSAMWEEIDLFRLCDKVLLIQTDSALREKRVKNRDQILSPLFRARINAQKEPPHPDFVVKNNGELKEFYGALKELKLFSLNPA
ncbi:dephospho-CoA kinase [Candidatus Peregrinibacteria bacterium CG_4_10_14_0_2_um_filter_43_11]|nr:MAG: dephospho-CoA kinase [Candidatus Peregrinibacteria bacterium CG_4_10_14_0_2_um_filter_43_11]